MPRSPARRPTSAPAPTRSWRRSRPTCSACRSRTSRVKLGDSTLPQSPVEGGSWTAASVAHAIAADCRRDAQGAVAPGAEDAGLAARRTRSSTTSRLADGKIVSKQDAARAVSIADAMRHGERRSHRAGEVRRNFDGGRQARAQHPFGGLRRGEGRRAARHHPRHARRQRGRGRPHPQPEDGAQPDHGRRGLGHRHGAARGDADRSPASAAS